jgi:multiple sugar transport system substrate-binding protein
MLSFAEETLKEVTDMKRLMYVCFLLTTVAAMVAACAPAPTPPPATAAPAATAAPVATTAPAAPTTAPAAAAKPKLAVWYLPGLSDEENAWKTKLFTDYGKSAGVDIELHSEPNDSYFKKLAVLMETGDMPDVWMTFETYLPDYRKANAIADLTDVVDQLKTRDGGLVESFVDGITWDGKQWGIGYDYWADAWYVRKDLLDVKGLKPPETYEDVAKIGAALADPKKPICGWGLTLGLVEGDPNFEAMSVLWAYGASVWGKDGSIALKSPQTKQVLQFLKNAWDAGAICEDSLNATDSSWNNKCYQSGACAMVQNAGSIARYLQKNDADLLSKTIIIPGPAGPAGRANVTNYEPWVVSAKSKNLAEAKKFLLWWYQPENQLEYMRYGNGTRFPIYKNQRNDPVWQKPLLQPFLENSKYSHPVWWPGPRTAAAMAVENDHTLTRMITRVLVEKQDIDKSIDQAVADLQKLQQTLK